MSNFQGLLGAVGIGVSQQSSATRTQQERDAYNTAMQNAAAAQNAMMNNAALQNVSGSIYSSIVTGNGYAGSQAVQLPPNNVYEIPHGSVIRDPNKNAAMTVPLSALVDLWRVKFGDTWMYAQSNLQNISDFEMWKMAAVRLHANNKFEIVAQYFRLREDA